MLRPGFPQLTYSAEEGARVAFNPELGQELDARTSGLLKFGEDLAVITDLTRENAATAVRDMSIVLSQAIRADGQRPFLEVRPGAYGGFLYRVSAELRASLDVIMSDEARAETVARNCFAAMDRMNRGRSTDEEELMALHFADGSHVFNSGIRDLNVSDGSIGNLYFGGDAGVHTIPGDMSEDGDIVRHYNTDHPHQALGLLLGVGSLAHNAYRHSLYTEMANVLAS
ncbi:MAG TPA: hypothetical protein VFW77_03990 [Candidatus Saccharimonadales bacterium]|nr:hypothetical protein [Candidatus Saccharimonadales bacterium]